MENKNLEQKKELLLQFDKRNGLLPVIVQEEATKDVLMLGYTNLEAFNKTISTGMATFWSTSRQQLWTKGETSGDYLHVVSVRIDCDQDAILYQVKLAGSGVCHTRNEEGNTRKSCFYRRYNFQNEKLEFLES